MRKSFTWLLSLMVTFGFLGIFTHGYAIEIKEASMLNAVAAASCDDAPVIEYTAEACYGGNVLVTITSPAGAGVTYQYWYGNNSAWITENTFSVLPGSEFSLRYRIGDSPPVCTSIMYDFTAPTNILEPFTFEAVYILPSCPDDQGEISVTAVGGTPPYTYWLSPNADGSGAQQMTTMRFPVAPGTWYVMAEEASDCGDVSWEMVEADNAAIPPIVIIFEDSDVTCNGEDNGTITVNVSQDLYEGEFMVTLDGGVTWFETVEGEYVFEDLEPGTYTVEVKSEDGCMETAAQNAEITEPEAITFKITITDTTCGGDNDGKILVSDIEGGVEPYLFSKDGTTWQSEPLFDGLAPIYHSIWVMDDNDCIVAYDNPNGTGNVIAVQSPLDLKLNPPVVVNAICYGELGRITVTATGGSGSYEYAYSTIIAVPSTWGPTNVFNLPAGSYHVWVRNTASPFCEVHHAVTITEPPLLALDIGTLVPPTCNEGSDGIIPVSIHGGTAPFRFSINNGLWSAPSTSRLIMIAAIEGTHTVKVMDANDCDAEAEDIVIDQVATIINATAGPAIICNGEKTSISAYVSGPAGRTYSYFYSTTSSPFPATGFTPDVTQFTAGTYYVAAVDQAYGCKSDVKAVTITQPAALQLVNVYSTGASCYATADGVITIIAGGGNGSQKKYAVLNTPLVPVASSPYWVNFPPADEVTGLSTASVQVNQGDYYVFIKDGCRTLPYGTMITVDGFSQLTIADESADVTPVGCYGEETGSITIPMSAVSGGAGTWMFTLLQDGEVVEGYENLVTAEFTDLPAGVYQVKVEDTEGCPSFTTADITVEQPDSPLMFDVEIQHFTCFGANDGLITISVEGGTAGYSYAINDGSTWFAFGEDVTSKTYVATETGTYTVWVKDANGCTDEPVEVTIWEPAPVVAEVDDLTDALCFGSSDGSVTIVADGGWDNENVSVDFMFKLNDGVYVNSGDFSGLPAGDHVVTVKAVYTSESEFALGNCEVEVPFTIGEPEELSFTFVVDDVACKGETTGSVTVTVAGGTPDDEDGYTVYLLHDGDPVDMLHSEEGNSVTFEGLAAGVYTVAVTDANDCSLNEDDEEIEIEVEEPDTKLTIAAQWIQNVSCFGGSDGSFSITASGGDAPYKFFTAKSVLPAHILLPDPSSSDWIAVEGDTYTKTNATAATWIVWTMDANGCVMGGEEYMGVPVNAWRVQILQPTAVVFGGTLAVTTPVSCNGAADGVITISGISASGGTAPYSLVVKKGADEVYSAAWTSGDVVLTGVSAGAYAAHIVDANGCTSLTKPITVGQPYPLSITIEKAEGQFACPDDVSGFIEAYAAGGLGNYQYRLWRNAVPYTGWVAQSSFLVQVGYSYAVEVRTVTTCTAVSNVLELNAITPAVITSIKDLTCFGATVPTARITATGEAGRTFEVSYQKRVGGIPEGVRSAWIPFNSGNSHVISTGLTYGDQNDTDGHYRFWVKDDVGCESEYMDVTFVPVQNALALTSTVEQGECNSEVSILVNGGIAPYEVWVNGEMMEAGVEPNVALVLSLAASEDAYEVTVKDSHECLLTKEVTIVAEPVVDEVTVEIFVGEDSLYVNEEYGVEEDLNFEGSPYTFTYTTEEGCERTLIVTVTEVVRQVAIAEIQGTGPESPVVGMMRGITGTVTGVVPGVGYYVQDAVAAWSGIWVADTETTVLIGNGVHVEGVVSEVNGVTTLTGKGTVINPPYTITAIVLPSPELAKDEMYESVLVQVRGVRAKAKDANGIYDVFTEDTKILTIGNWMYKDYVPEAGDWGHVTGIVNGSNWYLQPRNREDVDFPTSISVIDGIDFKVYPNPFNNELNIDNYDRLTRVTLTNIAGQRVIDVQYPERVIRTANLVSGVYVVTLFNESGIVKSERIVKR